MYIPTQEQYLAALEVIKSYELNQDILFEEKVETIKKRLDDFFNTKTDIKEFFIRNRDFRGNRAVIIYPTNPRYDEDYSGEFDEDLEAMSKEFGVRVTMDPGISGK
jgi:hypothetical protein